MYDYLWPSSQLVKFHSLKRQTSDVAVSKIVDIGSSTLNDVVRMACQDSSCDKVDPRLQRKMGLGPKRQMPAFAGC